jgi:hypothetical protein
MLGFWGQCTVLTIGIFWVFEADLFNKFPQSNYALAERITQNTPLAAAPGTLPATLFDNTLPPAWNAAQGMQMANILTSCSNFSVPVNAAMGSIQQGMMANPNGGLMGAVANSCPFATGVSITTVCPGSDSPMDVSSATSCANYNPNTIMMLEMQLNSAICTNQCKKGKTQAVQGELQCLMSQSNLLNQQANSLMTTFQSNIQRMQTDMQTIKSAQADRAAQIADVNSKLKGDPNSGSQGLIALQQATVAMVGQMPVEIQSVRNLNQSNIQAQKAMDEQVQIRRASLTMDCIQTRTVPSYRCEPNGPPVSAVAYLKCRYRQNQMLGANGVIERSAAQNAQADQKAAALNSILDQIVADSPNQAKMPTTQQEADATSQQPLLNLTVADIQAKYGDSLSQYKIGGATAEDFLMKNLSFCENRSNLSINLEKNRASTTIGKMQYDLRQKQQETAQTVNQLMTKYNQQYSSNISGLTGNAATLNVSACSNATTSIQIRCLEDMKSTMQGLLQGGTSNSTMNIQIKGNTESTYINFSCQGLNGCVSKMQNVSRNLVTEQQKLTTFKDQYALKAFQSTEAFVKQVASQMNPQSQILGQKMADISSALASLGAMGLNMQQAPGAQTGEQLRKDADGLPIAPNNMMNLIGQYVNPPLPNMGSNMSGSMMGLSNATSQIDANMARLQGSLSQIKNMSTTCAGEGMRAMADNAAQIAYQSSNCHNTEYCKQHLPSLQNNLGSILMRPGVSVPSIAALNSGIQSACMPPMTGQMNIMTDLEYNTRKKELNEEASRTGKSKYLELSQLDQDFNNRQPRGCHQLYMSTMSTVKAMEMSTGTGYNPGAVGARSGPMPQR